MHTVRARVWQFGMTQGQRVVATEIGRGDLPVGLARLVHINAMACDLRRVLDYRTKQLEARLLISYFDSPRAGHRLRLDHRAFDASSRHIRGFVSECSGLGVLTAASESLFLWRPKNHALHSFDALPKPLLRQYQNQGVRPDLLFHLPAGPIAGEARGRRRKAHTLLPKNPLAPQKARLSELAAWAATHNNHAFFMSWLWVGTTGVAVDIFLPEGSVWNEAMAPDWRTGETVPQSWNFSVPQRSPRARSTTDQVEHREGSEQVGSGPALQVTQPEIVRTPDEQAEEILNRLFHSAPEPRSSLLGIPVRGEWVSANMLGPSHYTIFLGVLAHRPPRQQELRRRLAWAQGRFDVCLDGRMLTVVRPNAAPEPEWRDLERTLFGE